MLQIIVAHENQTLRDLLQINLESCTGASIICRNSLQDVQALLEILPEISLIITQGGHKDWALHLSKFVSSNNRDTPIVVLGKLEKPVKSNIEQLVVVDDPLNWEETVALTTKLLGITLKNLKKKPVPDYIPMPVSYFLPLENSPCDVYIRIKKAPGDYQYIKRIHSDDSFSKETILRYQEQGLKYFYIPKDNHRNLVTFISNRLVELLEDDSLPEEEILQNIGEAHSIARQEILRMGLNSATIQLAETVIESMVKSIEKSPQMSQLLTKILNTKTGYIYQLSHLSTSVAFAILDEFGLDNETNRQKLVYCAFFCDLALVDREDLCLINSFDQLDSANLPSKDWDLVFNHPVDGAVFIRKYQDAPLGVDTMIKEHHGVTHGKGFSMHSFDELDPLSRIYIVAEQFIRRLLHHKNTKSDSEKTQIIPLTKVLKTYFKDSIKMLTIVEALDKALAKKNKTSK